MLGARRGGGYDPPPRHLCFLLILRKLCACAPPHEEIHTATGNDLAAQIDGGEVPE
jgi:hypothetical protein